VAVAGPQAGEASCTFRWRRLQRAAFGCGKLERAWTNPRRLKPAPPKPSS